MEEKFKKVSLKTILQNGIDIQNIPGLIKLLQSLSKEIESLISKKGSNALSYWQSSDRLIPFIEQSLEEDEGSLRVEAIICDIFNGYAHAIKSAQGERTPFCKKMFSYKDMMIDRIISMCDKEEHPAYGYSQDEEGKTVFAVDIPEVGQISWHDPRTFVVERKKYPYRVEKKTIDEPNESFLRKKYELLSQSEINKRFSPHMAAVMQSFDIESMNENLQKLHGRKKERGFLVDLKAQVAEPSVEELNIGSNIVPQNRKISVPGEQ